MYQAKGQGPSTHQFFDKRTNARDVEPQLIERSLGSALNRQKSL
jgi:hypothetical protein